MHCFLWCLHGIFTKAPPATARLFLGFLLLLLRFWCRKLESIRGPVGARTDLFPRAAASLEVAIRLCELKRLSHNALLLLIVADLGVASHREILAKRVALEAIVGHDTAEIWVAGEEDAKQVVDLALVPIRAVVEGGQAGDGGCLVGIGLDTDSRVVTNAKQVVHDLESLIAGGEIYGGDVTDLGELGSGVI